MVCPRCIQSVQNILDGLHIPYHHVLLGEAELEEPLPQTAEPALKAALEKQGFELIDDRRTLIIEKIKKTILEYLDELSDDKRPNLSVLIADNLNYEYTYLSDLFSSVEGITIEQFAIRQRIEKAKELLVYGQLSLTEIADKLGYSSVHHLSAQFKKITGLTPTHFRKIGASKRKAIDAV